MIFKNFCPYEIGDIYISTSSTNPSTKWLGTTWQKLEDIVLKGTSSTNPTTKQIIGSDTISIQKANLPNIKLKTDAHSHTQNAHRHGLYGNTGGGGCRLGEQTPYICGISGDVPASYVEMGKGKYIMATSGEGNTTISSLYTEALGNGTSLNIIQKSYIVNMWLRLS